MAIPGHLTTASHSFAPFGRVSAAFEYIWMNSSTVSSYTIISVEKNYRATTQTSISRRVWCEVTTNSEMFTKHPWSAFKAQLRRKRRLGTRCKHRDCGGGSQKANLGLRFRSGIANTSSHNWISQTYTNASTLLRVAVEVAADERMSVANHFFPRMSRFQINRTVACEADN